MKELSGRFKARVLDGMPESYLVLYGPALQGRSGSLIDRSPIGNNGTISGATWKRLPSGVKVLSFDGADDYVSYSHVASQLLTTGGTLEAWIHPTGWGENNVGRVFDKSTDTTNGDGFALWLNNAGIIVFGVNGGANRTSAGGSIVLNTTAHVAVTFSAAAVVTCYVNGSASGVAGATGALAGITTNNDLRIGTRSENTDRTFAGWIGNPKIYNRVLTATEIARHYAREYRLFRG